MVKPRWAAERSPDALLVTDARGVIEYVNPAFEKLSGLTRAELLGRTPAILKSGAHDAAFYRRLWRRLLAGKPYRGVFVNRRKDGRLFFDEEIILPVITRSGKPSHFVSSGRDVTRQVRSLRHFQHAATHDPLTDLPNRTLFLDRLSQAVRQAARRGEPLAVAIFDIDDFRAVNNHHGHLAGDAVLQAVAKRTRGCLRVVDTVARIGGDEFALILANVTRRAALGVIRKVLAANCAPVKVGRQRVPVGLSIGVCMYPRAARTENQLRKRADTAMYAAKRAGGARFRFAG